MPDPMSGESLTAEQMADEISAARNCLVKSAPQRALIQRDAELTQLRQDYVEAEEEAQRDEQSSEATEGRLRAELTAALERARVVEGAVRMAKHYLFNDKKLAMQVLDRVLSPPIATTGQE